MVKQCCVGGCDSTSRTQQLFRFPKIDSIRNLWMFFVVPTNPQLIGLTKDQLTSKCVCKKHFDKGQFDVEGKRLRFGYPCLFTDEEIAVGEPLPAPGTVHNDHNYCKNQEDDDDENFTDFMPISRTAETPKDAEQEPTDSLSTVVKAGSAPIKPDPKRNESENFEICISKVNDNYVVYVQEFNGNIVEESADVKPQRKIVKIEDFKLTPEHNYSSTLPEQEEGKKPIAPTTDELPQNVSQRKPLGTKNKKLKIAAKRLKTLKSEVLRQRKIIASLQDKLNNSTVINPLRYDKEKCLDIVTKNMTECGKIFTRMQCYQSQLNPHARRFNMKEKVLALTMFKTSPKCYRLLSNYFAMPSTKSLCRLLTGYTLKGDLNKANEE